MNLPNRFDLHDSTYALLENMRFFMLLNVYKVATTAYGFIGTYMNQ